MIPFIGKENSLVIAKIKGEDQERSMCDYKRAVRNPSGDGSSVSEL